ncbi:glycoside hydrolase family 3 protein [Microdochium trichocladiopsis]|uniref:Beta-glucosidase cel3A n=1 Tax=Microdochium trichocladiopsis TaxID=1682393 RepID=A0A9P9BJW9_9PEZI|nr:glycoside hydrolase family 3 protein [Microdochium trichocladiopsis]KAH7018573.1 glycoside hydrolase family 3 protein [Microdochium trichocladiopsis]
MALAPTGASAQTNSWDAAYTKARTALSKLSLSDKVGIVTGVGWNQGPCVGNVHAASAIGFPSLCLQDGPLGVRYASSITAFTPGVQAASTWDVELMRQRGQFLGVEAKQLGVHNMLGPVAGALGKFAEGGRNWEGFSPDPYLSGEGMRATVEGMQSAGVQATAKHWILNEQELNRNTMSSSADDRTVHELYVWPFMDAVKANVASFMCSYNRVSGTYSCENNYVMKELLKDQLGFKGYIMTDWGAQHSTVAAANTGLDMSMPGSNFNGGDVYWGQALTSAINSGSVNQTRVDDMVLRILAPWYLLGQDQGYPSVDLTRNVQGTHKTNVRAVARDGIVLLKNDNAVLPLKKPARIAVIGTGAYKGNHANNGPNCEDKACNNGALGMGWGSGSVKYPYFVAPYDAISQRASSSGTTVVQSNSDDTSQGANAARNADVALVFITADAGEGYLSVEGNAGDRNNLDPWHNGNALVKSVADVNSNVVVVAHSVGPIILESILSNPSVKAIVWAGLPSQESGNALVDVLWGDVSPSGKLVYTIAKAASDYGTRVVSGADNYPEGLFIDYRHFDQAGISPRYEFGFGLSYTNFTYAGLAVSSASATSGPATGPIFPGGPQDLWDTVATVTATITNSGGVQGAEVAQLYVTLPSSAPSTPPRQLRGFDKLALAPGQSGTATFSLTRRDLSYWDVANKKWVLPKGSFGISVGASSRDLRLRGTLQVS